MRNMAMAKATTQMAIVGHGLRAQRRASAWVDRAFGMGGLLRYRWVVGSIRRAVAGLAGESVGRLSREGQALTGLFALSTIGLLDHEGMPWRLKWP